MNKMDRHSPMEAYEAAHRVLVSSPKSGTRERRDGDRRPYRVLQWIAPYDRSGFPDRSQFFQVCCRDLSQSGISFVVSERPSFTTLVVSLGEPPSQTHMVAEIVRCQEVRSLGGGRLKILDDAKGDDDLKDQASQSFLVACQFEGRLK